MLAVEEIAMLTPLGNAEQTVAAIAAGISVFQESAFVNREYKPMKFCEIPNDALQDLPEEYRSIQLGPRRQRIVRLGLTALADLLEKMDSDSKLPVLLSVPEKLHGLRTPIDDRYLQLILKPFAEKLDIENSYVFPYGRASLAKTLDAARHMLEQGFCKQVIVGGVDSYRDPHLLELLDCEGRILAEGVLDGFAPGEAASFMLLSKTSENGSCAANIVSWAEASEPGHRYANADYFGEALSSAVTASLEGLSGKSITNLYANLNGEQFFAKEWGIAQLRNSAWLADEIEIQHPADCFGDLGAAVGPVQVGLIAGQSAASRQTHLICLSSELDTRSAVVVSTTQQKGRV